ncbi:hypothetical protein ACSNOJ_28850 [Streptomyces sp. URMC 128]|uniref:hypothetical protein n=1 Tax=Streptomyces sp. URMC 128 TaxID=3423404 RepID=UPI003F1DFF97
MATAAVTVPCLLPPLSGACIPTSALPGWLLWCAVLLRVFVPSAVRQYAHGER